MQTILPLGSDLFELALHSLVYPTGYLRPLTKSALQLVYQAKEAGIPEAPFLAGLAKYGFPGEAYGHFQEAQRNGVTHPLLYYYIGRCYHSRGRGVTTDLHLALNYYQQAIAAGCSLAYQGIFHLLTHGWPAEYPIVLRMIQFLEDALCSGVQDGSIYGVIASYYLKKMTTTNKRVRPILLKTAMDYADQAMLFGNGSTYRWMWPRDLVTEPSSPILQHHFETLLITVHTSSNLDALPTQIVLLLALVRYIQLHEHSLSLDDILKSYGFDTLADMTLRYTNKLVEIDPALGYGWLGYLCIAGVLGSTYDVEKGLSIWEKASKLGLASEPVLGNLVSEYMKKDRTDGAKALKYCEKALKVANSTEQLAVILRLMARVYDDGLKPIQVDAEKAQEYRTRAREMTESTNSDALEVYPGCDHMTGINDYSIDHVFSLTP